MAILIYLLTAVSTSGITIGFCKHTSKERRKDKQASTWSLFFGSNGAFLSPTSFNLAREFMVLTSLYAYQRGLPNLAMYLGSENSANGFLNSAACKFGFITLRLSSMSIWRARNGGMRSSGVSVSPCSA